ncbi:helix-turn-helix domain-containing protein [Aquimarina brevivitae]|uniref:Helix-turn-helix protein n=1 Tax=Aquimarina brevivitae TaxID=323412 RepID=A0A4Q7P1T2_9FLAO|nr:helix-turn-helix transcriptional regulator [Aquimarina brevivitae]RZS93288.1 helix-turn-helix protein [Aquimarina brevivitae]
MNNLYFGSVYLLFLCWLPNSYAQTHRSKEIVEADSLITKSYQELNDAFYDNLTNDDLYDLYANAFLKKAYQEKDTVKMARGYFNKTYRSEDKYFTGLDSLIKYAQFIDKKFWLWAAYYRKGTYYSDRREFKKALANEIKAYQIAVDSKLEHYEDMSLTSLAILKQKVGNNQEALKDFKKSYLYNRQLLYNAPGDTIDKNMGIAYLNRLHLLSNSYRLNGILDSANQLNMEAQKYRKYPWAKPNLNKIRLNGAEVHFDKSEYALAIDSAALAVPEFIENENFKSVAVCYYILGMSKIKLGQKKEGVRDLRKMDSIYVVLGNIYPAVRPGYEYLKKYYASRRELKNQLYFVEQLLRFDSIAHTNYAFVSNEITEKIDKPNLLQEHKELQEQLADTSKKSKKWYVIGIGLILILIFEILRRKRIIRKKNREKDELHDYYKKQFDFLIAKNEIHTIEHNKKEVLDVTARMPVDELDISKEIITSVLQGLRRFEDQQKFVDADITASSLAKKLGTNANYLGRIIKFHYQKSFRNYLNDLRLDLALNKLRNDKSFKNFSVEAMAREVGFKTAEPFSKLFKKRTGFYPSEFIKQFTS